MENETPQRVPPADDANDPSTTGRLRCRYWTSDFTSRLDDVIRLNGDGTAPHDVPGVPRPERSEVGIAETLRRSKQPEDVERGDDPAEQTTLVDDG